MRELCKTAEPIEMLGTWDSGRRMPKEPRIRLMAGSSQGKGQYFCGDTFRLVVSIENIRRVVHILNLILSSRDDAGFRCHYCSELRLFFVTLLRLKFCLFFERYF